MNIIQKSLVQNYFEDVIEIEKNEESTDGKKMKNQQMETYILF